MPSAWDEKWRPFQSRRVKDLSAPLYLIHKIRESAFFDTASSGSFPDFLAIYIGNALIIFVVGVNRSVGIATWYGLHTPGIESR